MNEYEIDVYRILKPEDRWEPGEWIYETTHYETAESTAEAMEKTRAWLDMSGYDEQHYTWQIGPKEAVVDDSFPF